MCDIEHSSTLSPPLPPSLPDGGDYGLDEKDMEASAATVRSLCEQIEADLIFLRERTEAGGRIRDYLIRRRVGELDFLEVRYALSSEGFRPQPQLL